jgi:hypothetical protein
VVISADALVFGGFLLLGGHRAEILGVLVSIFLARGRDLRAQEAELLEPAVEEAA